MILVAARWARQAARGAQASPGVGLAA